MLAPICETETIRDDRGPQRGWTPGFCIPEQLPDGSSVYSPESQFITTTLGTPGPTEHYILSKEKSARGCVVQALSSLTAQIWIIIPWLSSVQSLSRVRVFATPWIAAHQASLSITNSRSSLKLTSIESVMPSSHLILSSPFPPAPNPSQHQSLFQWVNSSHEVAKVLEFQL